MIDRYVAELDEALYGPRTVKADLLAEARDGLIDAAEAYEESGLDRASAERRAVADFGPVGTIAPDYQTELALAQGRRTAVLISAVLTIQPVAWWMLLRLAGHGMDDATGTGYDLVNSVVRWTGGGAIGMALAVAIATGAGVRYLGPRRKLVRAAGFFAFVVCAVFAVLGVLLTFYSTATESLLSPTGLPMTALLLGIPLVGIAVSGRRCLTAA
ncbi:permease prefix domain 1-containing protein [Streptomyces sp. NPDC088400]|uniref:permease prefix domain 1-containing protein n=1 Tax=Streptomyces sp. NPDC088400 TaxID=3365861 RepID=UPI0038128DD6